ncbi:MAG TPA: pyridoxamine 5'-phosphate oxidase, partial [Gammaproteobacteria bacterium]|nr:pyridoxamine 5'-phosphate oxidase [Gammaproteobacteria bacterium]
MNTMQTPELEEATFYNDLPQTLEKAWLLLEDAARNGHSPMHTPVLVSCGKDHTARARTVVLRDTVRTARELHIHTDSRSAKVEEQHRQPTCQVLTYHP